MKARAGLFFLFLFSVVPAASATIVRSITISGNHALQTRQLLDVLSLKEGDSFSRSRLLDGTRSVLRLYLQNGYYSAELLVDSLLYAPDSSTVDIVLGITEHSRLPLGAIHLEGNTVFTRDDILDHFETRSGDLLDQRTLEQDIEGLISRYEHSGYPFAKVHIDDISRSADTSAPALELDLGIDEGENVRIQEIKIIGNTETHEHVIVRETRIKPGEVFDQDKLVRIRQRLNRLNIFASVQEPELYMSSSGGGILIRVQEGTTNTFDGVIGYAPGSSAGAEGTVTGMVNVSMRNLFGTARKLHVQWLRDITESQEISAEYVEPWILDLPLNMGVGFLQRQQDSTYVRRDVNGKADLLVSESFSIGGIITHENIIPSETIVAQTVSDSRTTTAGVEIQYDSRDDPLSPTGGINYQSDYQIGKKNVSGTPGNTDIGSHTVQKISVDADYYAEVFHHQVLAVGIHARQLTSDFIEVGDLYRFGGTNSLRGYRENEFLGSRVAWTNTEYRFLLSRHSFFFGLFDTGYFFLPGDGSKGLSSIEHLKYGYGVGIRLETSLGNIGVSVALGEGDSFSQAKLHIGLINNF